MSKEIISKELLSLVLGDKVINISTSERDAIENGYGTMHSNCILVLSVSRCKMLNLDTLSRLCKKWCNKQNYVLESAIDKKAWCNYYEGVDLSDEDKPLDYTLGDTEQEAIVKATEWVAKEKGLL